MPQVFRQASQSGHFKRGVGQEVWIQIRCHNSCWLVASWEAALFRECTDAATKKQQDIIREHICNGKVNQTVLVQVRCKE
jgi:hypothetical protein